MTDASLATVEQTSAGGVVYREADGVTEIAIVKVIPEMRWQLPKGLIDPGETPEQAAVREVREESGIEGTIVDKIDTIDYWFVADFGGGRHRFHKFVHFYLMRSVGGDLDNHDHEVSESRWLTIDDALQKLEFKTERDVVTKAAAMIKNS